MIKVEELTHAFLQNFCDFEKDIETIRSYYKGVQGRNAENFVE